ncbi:cell division protein FtsA [Gehongia tenuis]|uniref:Cell division protein FtsA n=1 Tax=Gehongia tenuis TaxID=2763655 RepID=A0A926D3V6_9FIRM|nr:cell division protein FtsA [Gehongia tenuis]MBC8530862.1 cell division protein FtsA [Gehongia tenuis]
MRHVAAAVEIGTSKVVAIIAEGKANGEFDILGWNSQSHRGIRRGVILDPANLQEAMAKALHEAENQAHHKVKELYIGVPGCFIKSFTAQQEVFLSDKDKRIETHNVDELILRAEEFDKPLDWMVIHRVPCYFKLDDNPKMIVDPVGSKAKKMNGVISFVMANGEFMEDMQELAEAEGYSVKGFIATCLGEGLMLIEAEERDKTAILLDIGYYNTDVTVFKGDGIILHESIPLGGAHITSDLSCAFRLSVEQSEVIKRRHVFGLDTAADDMGGMEVEIQGKIVRVSDNFIQHVIECRVEEIAASVKNILRRKDARIPQRTMVYMAGGGIGLMRGAREFMTNALDHPVRVLTPKSAHMNSPVYAGALGTVDLSLIDPEQPENNSPTVMKGVKGAFKKISDFFFE